MLLFGIKDEKSLDALSQWKPEFVNSGFGVISPKLLWPKPLLFAWILWPRSKGIGFLYL